MSGMYDLPTTTTRGLSLRDQLLVAVAPAAAQVLSDEYLDDGHDRRDWSLEEAAQLAHDLVDALLDERARRENER